MELMVRRRERRGEEAEGEPWKAYKKMGMTEGRLGARGEMGYEGVKGCSYMRGAVARRTVEEEREAWGRAAVTDMVYIGHIEGRVEGDIRDVVMRAHGLSDEAVRRSIEGGRRRYVMVIHDTAKPRGSECEEERSDGEGGVGHEEGGRDGEDRGRHDGEGMGYREDSGEGTGGWRVVTGRRGGKQTGTGRGTESSTRDGGGVHAVNERAVGETMERGTDRDEAGQHSTTDNTSTPARRARRTEEEEEDTDGEDEEGNAMLRRWMREMQQRGRRGKDGGAPQDTQQGGNTRGTQQRRAEAGKGGASSSAAAGMRTQEKGKRRGRNAPRDGEAGSGETARRRSASAAERTGGEGNHSRKIP